MVHPLRDTGDGPNVGVEPAERLACMEETRTEGAVTGDPYAMLDPASSESSDQPMFAEASGLRVVLRGLGRRCPRCGEPRIFERRFTLKPRCPRCDLRFEKEEGGFLGAMALNYGVAVLFWLIVMAVGIALTAPVVPVAPLLVASIGVLTVVPVWFYPRSKALWAAIEFLVERSQPNYRPPVRRDPRAKGLE